MIANKLRGFKEISLLFFLLLLQLYASAQMSGGSNLVVGQTSYGFNAYQYTGGPVTWSSSSLNTAVVGDPNNPGNPSVRSLLPNCNESNCMITISATYYDSYSYSVVTVQKTVQFLPFIAPCNGAVYVGQTTMFHVQDNCITTGCTYNWNVGGGLCASPCVASASNYEITCPVLGYPNSWNLSCILGACYPLQGDVLTLKGIVKLGPIASITGATDIGCSWAPPVTTYPLVYSIPAIIGANSYNWSIPNFLSIISGASSNAITVVATSTGQGVVSVQAVVGGTSIVKSDVSSMNVNLCCVPVYTLTSANNVNSPITDTKEAAINILATNTINSGGSAMYHAGGQIQMNPGFSAVFGSYYHAYISQCSGAFNRPVYVGDSLQTINNPDQIITHEYSTPKHMSMDTGISEDQISVFPNPSKGTIYIVTAAESELLTITITDVSGKTIQVTNTGTKNFKAQVNIDADNGMYFLKISDTNNKSVIKKVILNK